MSSTTGNIPSQSLPNHSKKSTSILSLQSKEVGEKTQATQETCHGSGCTGSRKTRSSYEGSTGIKESGRSRELQKNSICMNDVDITNPARICSKHDLMVDSMGISDKDGHMTNSHARRIGLTCEEDQALPRWGPSSGTGSWLPLRGARKIGVRRTVAGEEEEEQCRRSRHSSRRTGATEDTDQGGQEQQNKQGLRRRRRLIRDPCIGLDEEGTPWRGSWSSVAGDTAKDV
ncbi:uncharacterized protein UHOR_05792 [Ustilago hordei]|uniref:Uncharacterized protein n=1 Tax=Ustilago hordei TaxID=120017 RepID=I2FMD1_USTHO|nr:uncharacterized protein UHOR_05792 [Ustilago hordei]